MFTTLERRLRASSRKKKHSGRAAVYTWRVTCPSLHIYHSCTLHLNCLRLARLLPLCLGFRSTFFRPHRHPDIHLQASARDLKYVFACHFSTFTSAQHFYVSRLTDLNVCFVSIRPTVKQLEVSSAEMLSSRTTTLVQHRGEDISASAPRQHFSQIPYGKNSDMMIKNK